MYWKGKEKMDKNGQPTQEQQPIQPKMAEIKEKSGEMFEIFYEIMAAYLKKFIGTIQEQLDSIKEKLTTVSQRMDTMETSVSSMPEALNKRAVEASEFLDQKEKEIIKKCADLETEFKKEVKRLEKKMNTASEASLKVSEALKSEGDK